MTGSFYAMQYGYKAFAIIASVSVVTAVIIHFCEKINPHFKYWSIPQNDVKTDAIHVDVSMGIIPQVLDGLLSAVLLVVALKPTSVLGFAVWPHDWHLGFQLILALLISQFGTYWSHRLMHEVPLLWRLHATHHSPKRLYWLNAGRFHPLDTIFGSSISLIPLLILGVPLMDTGLTLVRRFLKGIPFYSADRDHLHHRLIAKGYSHGQAGALLIGCDAGTLNMPKIKGSHTAMKSGMIAAETINEHLKEQKDLSIYEKNFQNSWAFKELKAARNVKPSFSWGLILGIIFTGIDQILFRGRLPFTLKHKHADHETLKPASEMPKIDYPKPDNVITFDKTSSVYLTGTNHAENQPVHLQLKDPSLPISYTLEKFDEPAQRYCPVGVYEIQRDQQNLNPKFIINSQNCIHCKTCDIKEPSQNINWVTPEGSGGPRYGNM